MKSDLIKATAKHVRGVQDGEGTGHDWWHTQRVWRNAIRIAHGEQVDLEIVELGALLHDLGDPKLHDGDDTVAPRLIREWLSSQGVPEELTEAVLAVVKNVSFKNTVGGSPADMTMEAKVVQDADRLDALGAIGIARAFAFGGKDGRPLYDPNIAPKQPRTTKAYLTARTTTVNHFYDKLLLLKDRMNTDTGRRLAERRHAYTEAYLVEFYREWDGEA